MARDKPTTKALRVELSNLRDDLAVIESTQIFVMSALSNQEAIIVMRRRTAE